MYGISYYDTTCHSYLLVLRDGQTLAFVRGDEAEAAIDQAGWDRREWFNEPNAPMSRPRFGFHVLCLNRP